MNAEQDTILSEIDRFSLVQSEHQTKCILSQCRFPPTESYMEINQDLDISDFQNEFIQESSCMVCKQIPLQPKECYNCNKIICFLCELKQLYKNGSRTPNFQCYNCKTTEKVTMAFSSEKSGSSSRRSKGKSSNFSNPCEEQIEIV